MSAPQGHIPICSSFCIWFPYFMACIEDWRAIVHGVTKSQTRLSTLYSLTLDPIPPHPTPPSAMRCKVSQSRVWMHWYRKYVFSTNEWMLPSSSYITLQDRSSSEGHALLGTQPDFPVQPQAYVRSSAARLLKLQRKLSWEIIKTQFPGHHSQTFRVCRPGWGPKNLHF